MIMTMSNKEKEIYFYWYLNEILKNPKFFINGWKLYLRN